MEMFLTLVIAVAYIATGIGAIWAALVARRQAQVTERSLAEQNERARLTLEYDLLTRLDDRAINPYSVRQIREASKYLRDNAFVGDDIVELPSFPFALGEVCDFFDEVGALLRQGVLRAESVWNVYGILAQAYWLVCKPTIEKEREEWKNPTLYENFEYLCRALAELDRKRGVPAHTPERLRQLMEDQSTRDEEPPTTPERGHPPKRR